MTVDPSHAFERPLANQVVADLDRKLPLDVHASSTQLFLRDHDRATLGVLDRDDSDGVSVDSRPFDRVFDARREYDTRRVEATRGERSRIEVGAYLAERA